MIRQTERLLELADTTSDPINGVDDATDLASAILLINALRTRYNESTRAMNRNMDILREINDKISRL